MPNTHPTTAYLPHAAGTPAAQPAELLREYGPFGDATVVHGVTHDGRRVWAATGTRLVGFDPATGEAGDSIAATCDAGTAFDGTHFWQIAGARIHKLDAASGKVLASIPTPSPEGCNSGMTWAEGSLWVGDYQARKIHRIDPATGAVQRTLESNRFVTGVTWVDGDLWHGTWEGDDSELRRVDAEDGRVLQRLQMPAGTGVSGLESDGGERFYCGGGGSGTVRAVRRPKANAA